MNLKKLIKTFNFTSVQILLLVLLTVLSYGNILQNSFAWDDSDFFEYWFTIKNGKTVSAIYSLPDLLAGDLPENHRGVYRPIRSVYYLLSYQLYGNNPVFYHLQAIVVQTLIVILIYLIINLILKSKYAALIGAAIFATHPVHTEAISFTTASMDTIGILFFFAAFYFYIRARKIKDQPKLTFFLSSVLAVLSFFTYEMTLVLPLLIVLYEFTLNNFRWKQWKEYLPFIPYFAGIAFYTYIRFVFLKIGNRADYLGHQFIVSANIGKITTPEFYLEYLKLLILPINLTVTPILPTALVNAFFNFIFTLDPSGNLLNQITPLVIVFPILFVLIVLIICFFIFRREKVVFFSISWFMISLLTVSHILPQGAAFAERFVYIASFGFSLLIAYFTLFLSRIKLPNTLTKKIVISFNIIILLLLVFYTTVTIKRNSDWKNGEILMNSALKVNPNSFLALGNLGVQKLSNKEYDQAIQLLKQALAIDPSKINTQQYLGLAYLEKGEVDKSIQHFQEVIKMEPNLYSSHAFLGSAYLKANELSLAEAAFLKAIELNPRDSKNYFNLGVVYTKLNKYDQALDAYKMALDINPYYKEALINTGYIYLQQNNYKKALEFYNQALDLNSKETRVYLALAEIHENLGDLNRAKYYYNKLLEFDKNNSFALTKLEILKGKNY